MRLGTKSIVAASLVLLAGLAGVARADQKAEEVSPPDYKEVYDLVRAHLAGVTEDQLNDAAVRGLISTLAPRVALVTNGAAAKAASETPVVKGKSVFDGDLLYVRVGRVGPGLADAVKAAVTKPDKTNKLDGVVLDLRYADGTDYAAAAATADLFVRKDEPLLNWGNGMVRSKATSDDIKLPVAVLVNRETSRAAEALAAVLRETGTGLILGSRTAGEAMVTQEYPLKNGGQLRIATAPVQLGNGSTLSEQGLKPDIAVQVSPVAERVYYADAYASPQKTNLLMAAGSASTNAAAGTNQAMRRPRFNEAELVRERREGLSEADLAALRTRDSEEPTVQDPALARALDLLRGLALVRQSR